MKTLKDAFELSMPLDVLATSVPVADKNKAVGIVLRPLHEKIYEALVRYNNKPIYIEWALFEMNDGSYQGYADVVDNPNPNLSNFVWGEDERDLKPINVLRFSKQINSFKEGKIHSVFDVSFMLQSSAFNECSMTN